MIKFIRPIFKKKLKLFLFSFFFLLSLNGFSQNAPPENQMTVKNGFGFAIEYGVAVYLPKTPKIQFTPNRNLSGYKGVPFFDSYSIKFQIHLNKDIHLWITNSYLKYEKEDPAATQVDGSIQKEDGEITFESQLIEFPVYLYNNGNFLDANFHLGMGIMKAGYNTSLDGTGFKDVHYMQVYSVGAGLRFNITDNFFTSLYYNNWFISSVDDEQFSTENMMLTLGYRIF